VHVGDVVAEQAVVRQSAHAVVLMVEPGRPMCIVERSPRSRANSRSPQQVSIAANSGAPEGEGMVTHASS
jgi:hypothetical protein